LRRLSIQIFQRTEAEFLYGRHWEEAEGHLGFSLARLLQSK
jgi:hypothetical protein